MAIFANFHGEQSILLPEPNTGIDGSVGIALQRTRRPPLIAAAIDAGGSNQPMRITLLWGFPQLPRSAIHCTRTPLPGSGSHSQNSPKAVDRQRRSSACQFEETIIIKKPPLIERIPSLGVSQTVDLKVHLRLHPQRAGIERATPRRQQQHRVRNPLFPSRTANAG
jgi:hypothetical protein